VDTHQLEAVHAAALHRESDVSYTSALSGERAPSVGGVAPRGSHPQAVPQEKAPAVLLLDRLLRQERDSLRLVAALAPPLQFEELFELYRASGFLYPAKLAALDDHLPSIERTSRKALAAGSQVFRLVTRLGIIEGAVRLRNAISAFAYAPGTWHGQHLVSRQRHEYTGTLAVLMGLVEGLHDDRAAHIRLSFRPNNPGTRMLFGEVARRLPSEHCTLAVYDYGRVPAERVRIPATPAGSVTVKPVPYDAGTLAEDFYRRVLHPVELASLALQDPELRRLDAAYCAAKLRRRRKVLVAIDHGEVLGACLVHNSSLGLNFSFLENAVEHLRARPDLCPRRRTEVWNALATAAVREARSDTDEVVLTLDPRDRDLSVPAGLIVADPKQYAVLTVAREGDSYLRSIDCFVDYYRSILAAGAGR
jgi:hypothetical protein